MQMPAKNQQGFTLVELLIVVAIIGILAAIAIPQFTQYRASARDSAALSDIRNAQTALESYYAQNGKYPGSDSDEVDSDNDDFIFGLSDGVDFDYGRGVDGDDDDNDQAYSICVGHENGDRSFYTTSEVNRIYKDAEDVDDPNDCDPAATSDLEGADGETYDEA